MQVGVLAACVSSSPGRRRVMQFTIVRSDPCWVTVEFRVNTPAFAQLQLLHTCLHEAYTSENVHVCIVPLRANSPVINPDAFLYPCRCSIAGVHVWFTSVWDGRDDNTMDHALIDSCAASLSKTWPQVRNCSVLESDWTSVWGRQAILNNVTVSPAIGSYGIKIMVCSREKPPCHCAFKIYILQ